MTDLTVSVCGIKLDSALAKARDEFNAHIRAQPWFSAYITEYRAVSSVTGSMEKTKALLLEHPDLTADELRDMLAEQRASAMIDTLWNASNMDKDLG